MILRKWFTKKKSTLKDDDDTNTPPAYAKELANVLSQVPFNNDSLDHSTLNTYVKTVLINSTLNFTETNDIGILVSPSAYNCKKLLVITTNDSCLTALSPSTTDFQNDLKYSVLPFVIQATHHHNNNDNRYGIIIIPHSVNLVEFYDSTIVPNNNSTTGVVTQRLYFLGFYNNSSILSLLQHRSDSIIRRFGAIAFLNTPELLNSTSTTAEQKSLLKYRSLTWNTSVQSTKVFPVTEIFDFFSVRDVGLYKSQKTVVVSNTIIGKEKHCERCEVPFTFLRRRHHCRMCHYAVCQQCSPCRRFLPGSSSAQRVCNTCADKAAPPPTSSSFNTDCSIPPSSTSTSSKLSVQDFELLKVVGKGAFGKVMMVKKKNDSNRSRVYAMKVLKKASVFAKNQVEHTKSERRILVDIDHPFVVRLRFAFQTNDKLYLVMDYYNGGSLFYHLRKVRKFDVERATFYAAQIVLAMEHLHDSNIAYRDLKLENILMDSDGYIALTDFGLSKENVELPNGVKTFCGTAEYIAPELLRGLPYGKAVDWWGFGTLLYEMLTGTTPFFDRNRKKMFHNILHREVTLDKFDDDTRDILSLLLKRDPTKRLGGGGGAAEVKEHVFFRNVDWAELEKRQVRAPFVPKVPQGAKDTTNIANVFTREIPRDSPVDAKSTNALMNSVAKKRGGRSAANRGSRSNSAISAIHFEGFTYVPDSSALFP